jgi:hypothetical protein
VWLPSHEARNISGRIGTARDDERKEQEAKKDRSPHAWRRFAAFCGYCHRVSGIITRLLGIERFNLNDSNSMLQYEETFLCLRLY